MEKVQKSFFLEMYGEPWSRRGLYQADGDECKYRLNLVCEVQTCYYDDDGISFSLGIRQQPHASPPSKDKL